MTGGSGFIGSALVRHLLAATDHDVLNVDKGTYAAAGASMALERDNNRYQHRRLDIADAPALHDAVSSFRPEVVVHLAAETHVDRSIDDPSPFVHSNIVGTFQLLEVVRRYCEGLRGRDRARFCFLHVSTDEVFGSLSEDDPPFDGSTPYAPRSPYSASKAASDHLARAWHATYGLPVVVTHCSNNYGPYQFPEKLIPLMIVKALRGELLPVYGSGSNVRDWLHVEDHARGLMLAAEKGQAGATYLFGCAEERTNVEVVEAICDLLDERVEPLPAPRRTLIRFVPDRPGHDLRYAIDPARARDDLGWRPGRGFDEGLAQTVDWFVANEDWWEPILRTRYHGQRLGVGAG